MIAGRTLVFGPNRKPQGSLTRTRVIQMDFTFDWDDS